MAFPYQTVVMSSLRIFNSVSLHFLSLVYNIFIYSLMLVGWLVSLQMVRYDDFGFLHQYRSYCGLDCVQGVYMVWFYSMDHSAHRIWKPDDVCVSVYATYQADASRGF